MSDNTGSKSRKVARLLHGPDRFKLAVFGLNVSGGCSMTSAGGTIQVEWPETVALAQAADAVGFDALVPVARWRGFGGNTNFNDRCFETFTWAAGVAAVTKNIQVFSTFHTPTLHPIRGAKEVATIDHISGGRFGLNVVAGWNETEIRMFGIDQREHGARYQMSDEWVALAKRLWTEDTFDFEGEFYKVTAAHSSPQPIQRPHPVIMSAGASKAGREFAAKHADINFVNFDEVGQAADTVREIKAHAKEAYGRDIKVMTLTHVVCRDTEAEAREFYDYYVNQKGDWAGVENMLKVLVPNSKSVGYGSDALKARLVAGYAAIPLIGTPSQVAEGLHRLSEAGLDGVTVSWVDYAHGIDQFGRQVLPLLQQMGLRA